jgi:hypothetical protein
MIKMYLPESHLIQLVPDLADIAVVESIGITSAVTPGKEKN